MRPQKIEYTHNDVIKNIFNHLPHTALKLGNQSPRSVTNQSVKKVKMDIELDKYKRIEEKKNTLDG